jgi:hypothetical protein
VTTLQEFVARVGCAIRDQENDLLRLGPWTVVVGAPMFGRLGETYEPLPYTLYERLLQIPRVSAVEPAPECVLDFYLKDSL